MDPVDPMEGLIRRVAFALRGRAYGTAAPREGGAPAGPADGTARIARFRERFEAQGGRCLEGPSLDPMLPILGEALRQAGVTALLFPPEDAGARVLAEALAPFGPFPIVSPAEARGPSAPAVAGIQTADGAVAETGSIVQTSLGRKTLLPGLIAEVHVALLTRASFVDRIDECLLPMAGAPPRNISIITGPSRTGDIEQTMTVGAHGPKAVIAVLLTSPSP